MDKIKTSRGELITEVASDPSYPGIQIMLNGRCIALVEVLEVERDTPVIVRAFRSDNYQDDSPVAHVNADTGGVLVSDGNDNVIANHGYSTENYPYDPTKIS